MTDAVKVTCTETVKQVRAEPMYIIACVMREFRSPIMAILAAAENIRDGLLEDKESLREYGTIIIVQAMRLMNLWEQILLYAGKYEDPGATCGR
jgi:hypothetical protein